MNWGYTPLAEANPGKSAPLSKCSNQRFRHRAAGRSHKGTAIAGTLAGGPSIDDHRLFLGVFGVADRVKDEEQRF